MRFLALALVLLLPAAAPAPQSRYLVTWGMESRVYPGDGTGHDFVAVFDIGDPANFGRLVAMLPVPTHSQMAHHANYVMPQNHLLFANDFLAGRTYVFDLADPHKPRIAASFLTAGPYSHPHSFAYLSNGNVLAAYQVKGPSDGVPGALVELDTHGRVIRASDASAARIDPYIRPYSVLPLEKIDRVVTTSADMFPGSMGKSSHVVQVWRLSDLRLLKTVVLPQQTPSNDGGSEDADEARVLSDGHTVLVKTASCGLYRLNGLQGTNPSAQFVYDYGYRSCPSVPVVVGHYWIQPMFRGHDITSLDVSDPAHPVEAGHLMLGSTAIPHWMAVEPGTGNLVITGYGSMRNHIYFAHVDSKTGALTLLPQTINMVRKWPDGWDGPAIPHATLFY